MPTLLPRARTAWTRRSPYVAVWVARLVQVVGLLDVVSAVLPASRPRLHLLLEVVPLIGVRTAAAATAGVGLLLVYLGAGLRRRKHRAWCVAVVLAAASVGLNLVKGLDAEEALLSAALLGILIAARREFYAESDPAGPRRALGAACGFAGAGVVLGLAETAVRSGHIVGHPSFGLWLTQAALGLIGVAGPVVFGHPGTAQMVSLTTGAAGMLALGVGLVLLLRPGTRPATLTSVDEQRLRRLLAAPGDQDSLGYFALRRDKSVMWSPSGKAAVAYRIVRGVSLAAGDPVGDPEAWPGAIEAWLEDARRHAWIPAVLGCGERGGLAYRRYGLDALELGDEAIVDIDDFTTEGRPMRTVRQAVHRAERAGYRCLVGRQRDLPGSVVVAATEAADRFRDGDVERGFSMALSRLGDPADGDCVLVLGYDADGALRGVLQLVPWAPDGLSLDLMRRDPGSDNGLVELMVTTLIRQAPELGVRRLSLNFAVLRSVFARGERIGAGPVLRLWHRALVVASRFWQIESLYRANAKYRPSWEPRYLCFPAARELPRIALAALQAEAFLVAPRPFRRRAPVAGRQPWWKPHGRRTAVRSA